MIFKAAFMDSYRFYSPRLDIFYAPPVASVNEMEKLGSVFGAVFLQPLITRHHSISAAVFGPEDIGKTTFLLNAIRPFSEFYAAVDKSHKENRHFEATVSTFEDSRHVLWRWKDLAYYDPADEGIPVRDKSAAGFDCLEHPTIPHINNADIVILFGTYGSHISYKGDNQLVDYYSEHENPGYGPALENIRERSSNMMAREISDEMWRMQCLARAFNPHSPAVAYGERARWVTFILSSREPAKQEAFDRLRDHIKPYEWFDPLKTCRRLRFG